MANNDLGTPPSMAAPGLPAGYDPSTGVVPPSDMVEVGNIDVNHRPIVYNDDGSSSTIYSATIPIEDGKWALIPTIVNGKFLTPDGKMPKRDDDDANRKLEDAARDYYTKSKEHLGIFKSQKGADDFAGATHAWWPNGKDEKVYLPHYEGETNGPQPKPKKDFSDLGGKPVKSKSRFDFSDLGGKHVDK